MSIDKEASASRSSNPSDDDVRRSATFTPADSGKTMCPAPAHLATLWHTPSAPLASTPCPSSTNTHCRWRLPQSMSSSRHVAGANGGDEDGAGDDEDGEASSVAFGDRLERRLRRGFDRARVDGDVHGGVDAARADHAIVGVVDPWRRRRVSAAKKRPVPTADQSPSQGNKGISLNRHDSSNCLPVSTRPDVRL